jgi:pimeloyl-ACP methyl ester carboxylesterase
MTRLKTYSIILLCTCLQFGLKGQHYFESFDQSSIYYEDLGQGEAVVLLHGFINTSKNWLNGKLPEALLAKGYRVIIPDLRGNGQSDKPHDLSAYTDHAEIKDIVALMQHLGIEHYHIVGYSRGAILAADLIANYQNNILSATLGGMGLDFTNPEWPRRKMFAEAFSGKSHLYPETQGAVTWAKKIGADTMCLSLQQYAQPSTSQTQLSKITIPVLVIAGDEDKDNGDPKILANKIPNAKLVIIKGNHNQSHSTQAFADAVANFILSLKTRK